MSSRWPHQERAFQFARDKEAVLFDAAMGVGKTKITLDLLQEWGAQNTLVICPHKVIPVWPLQVQTHAPNAFTVTPLYDGSVAKKTAFAVKSMRANVGPNLFVINYDSAWREPFRSWALKQRWDVAISDESHRVKAPNGKASWFMKALGIRADRRIGLSGTPMPHSPLDIYAQFRFLDQSIFGTSFTRFKSRYSISHPVFKSKVLRWINQDELHDKMAQITFRITKEEGISLPPVTHNVIPVNLEPKALKIYRELEREFYAEVDSGDVTPSNALTKMLRLQQVTSGHITRDDLSVVTVGNEKESALVELLDDIDHSEPVVVFCRFRKDLEATRNAAAAAGRLSSELSGSENSLQAWKDGETSVLAVQIQSGSEGVDLTRARYCVFYSLDFSLGRYDQALARVHRPGQTRPTSYYHLVVPSSIDEKVYSALSERRDVVTAVLEGRKS